VIPRGGKIRARHRNLSTSAVGLGRGRGSQLPRLGGTNALAGVKTEPGAIWLLEEEIHLRRGADRLIMTCNALIKARKQTGKGNGAGSESDTKEKRKSHAASRARARATP